MRESHGGDKMRLKIGFDRGFDFFDFQHPRLDFAARCRIQQRNARAGSRRIARTHHAFRCAIGYQAQHHGVYGVDMGAKGSGQGDAIQLCHAIALHQQFRPGI